MEPKTLTPSKIKLIPEIDKEQQKLSSIKLNELWSTCGNAGLQTLRDLADTLNSFGLFLLTFFICLLLQLGYCIDLLKVEADKEPQRESPVYFIAFWLLIIVVIWLIVRGLR